MASSAIHAARVRGRPRHSYHVLQAGGCGRKLSAAMGGVMSYTLKAVAGIGLAMILSGRATASGDQGVVMQRNLSLAMAKTIAEATLAACKSKGFSTAAVVVDRAGQVLVMLRDEQGTAQMLEMARRKAYTARM